MLKYVVTGGTLSSFRDDEGKLVPSKEGALKQLESMGIGRDDIKTPLIIDSIDYDISKHSKILLDTAKQVLDDGDTPIFCGGTDTKIWYSTLLTKQLQQQGYLKEGSGQKIIFTSSMFSLEAEPEHVRKILESANAVAEEESLAGGFALSAERKDADTIDVHDVSASFDKISANMANAFRSEAVVGHVRNATHLNLTLEENRPSVKPLAPKDAGGSLSRIAPPLLMGHDSRAVIAYLNTVGTAKPRYDGVVIEGLPGYTKNGMGRLYDNDTKPLIDTVKWLKEQNIQVVFNNKLDFNAQTLRLEPVIPEEKWEKSQSALVRDLKGAGAEFTTGLTKDAYLNLMLSGAHANSEQLAAPEAGPNVKQKVIGLRYVPDQEIMHQAVNDLEGVVKNIVFSALPNNILPEHMNEVASKHKKTKFYSAFAHNGKNYVSGSGEAFREVPKANKSYAAAASTDIITDLNVAGGDAVKHIYCGHHAGRQ